MNMKDLKFPDNQQQTQKTADGLGNDGRNRSTGCAEMQNQNAEKIQKYIQESPMARKIPER